MHNYIVLITSGPEMIDIQLSPATLYVYCIAVFYTHTIICFVCEAFGLAGDMHVFDIW